MTIINGFYRYFLRPGKDLKSYGAWAIVTGATDGIGKALSLQLAKKKINIVLISRTETKLQEFGKELETAFKVRSPVTSECRGFRYGK